MLSKLPVVHEEKFNYAEQILRRQKENNVFKW